MKWFGFLNSITDNHLTILKQWSLWEGMSTEKKIENPKAITMINESTLQFANSKQIKYSQLREPTYVASDIFSFRFVKTGYPLCKLFSQRMQCTYVG